MKRMPPQTTKKLRTQKFEAKFLGSPSRTRTYDALINSQVFYRLNYRGIKWFTQPTKIIILLSYAFVNNFLIFFLKKAKAVITSKAPAITALNL